MDSVQELTEGVSLVLEVGKQRRHAYEGWREEDAQGRSAQSRSARRQAQSVGDDASAPSSDGARLYNAKGALRTNVEPPLFERRR